ncbi:MAG: hypothetical protein OJF49_000290 [Ktedonobacterales bacterium]|jgi:hypothetical protein|nr:MAG: hypothetical protein OJF49_000290 [Ktedonobacterales bacterium]
MMVNVPVVNQRTQQGADGRPPEDGNMDCVPASLSAMVQALTSCTQNADAWHDAVYGQGYVGMQDPARYVDYAGRLGVRMTTVWPGTPQEMLARVVADIRAGHPVLLSIPSDWLDEPPHSQYAHMVAGCDVSSDGGELTCMNPWTAAYETYTLAWWAERLGCCSYKTVWVLEKVEGSQVDNWTDVSDASGAGAKDQHGNELRFGQAAYVLANKSTANAIEGVAAQAYPFGGDFSVTALEDGTALIYGKASNVVSHVGGDAGAVVSGLYLALVKLQQADPGQGGNPPLPPGNDAADVSLAAVRALAAALAEIAGAGK